MKAIAQSFFHQFLPSSRSEIIYALLITLMLIGALGQGFPHGADFEVFYRAGLRFAEGLPLFQASDGWAPFKYHPAWGGYFALWTFLSEKGSLLLFNTVNLAIWAHLAYFFAKAFGYTLSSYKNWFFLLALSFSFLTAELAYGQVNSYIILGITYLFLLLESENSKPIAAGFIAILLFSLKLNAGLFVVWALYRNWRSLWGMLIGAGALHLITAFYHGSLFDLTIYKEWISLLLTQSSDQFFTFEVQGFYRFFNFIFKAYGKYVWFLGLLAFAGFALYLDYFKRVQFKRRQVKGQQLMRGQLNREDLKGRHKSLLADFGPTTETSTRVGGATDSSTNLEVTAEASTRGVSLLSQNFLYFQMTYWLSGFFLFSPLAWAYQTLFMYPMLFFLLSPLMATHVNSTMSSTVRSILKGILFVYAFVTFNTLGREYFTLFKEMMGFFLASFLLLILFISFTLKTLKTLKSESKTSSPLATL